MNTRIWIPAVALLGIVGLSGWSYGLYQAGQQQGRAGLTDSEAAAETPQFATVTGVTPIRQAQQRPEQVCEWVSVQQPAPVKDEHKIVGSVVGATIGGVIGHQFGGGRGKDAATVAGAIAGGAAGRAVQGRQQQSNTVPVQTQQCRTEMKTDYITQGYRVQWRLGERTGELTMDKAKAPGDRLPVRDGQVVAG